MEPQMSQPPQPPYSGQPYPEQPDQGQPYGQPYSGQPYSGQPYSGQPYSGQPNPDVPSSVPPQPGFPPAYGQQPPQSGQPDYGQPPQYASPPQYGQPGYPPGGGYPPPPPKKSRAVPIILISLAVLLVLCVGGGTAIYITGRNTAQDIVNAAKDAANPTPTATTADQSTDSPATPVAHITVVEPTTLGGRPKLTDPTFTSLAQELKSGLADVPEATSTVGALYGSFEKRNIVVIAGAAAPIADPKKELDDAFDSAGLNGLKATGIVAIDPGPLGGEAKCGKTTENDISLVLCGWADNGSLGIAIFFFQTVAKAKAEFPKLRAQIEKKSS
jgi:hypothetical protein